MTLNEKCLMPFSLCFLDTLSPFKFKASIQVSIFWKANMPASYTSIIDTVNDVAPSRHCFKPAYIVVTDDRLL